MQEQTARQHKLARSTARNRLQAGAVTCKKIDKWLSNLVSNVGERPVTTTINVTFEDDDYELLKETKDEDETWHDWLLRSAELRRREVN